MDKVLQGNNAAARDATLRAGIGDCNNSRNKRFPRKLQPVYAILS